MNVSEIKVSYSANISNPFKITSSKDSYNCILSTWNLDIIEFQEESKIILLNRANLVLGIYPLSRGGIAGTVVDIKIILSVALTCNASGLILVHNHPSGNLKASEADIQITRKLKESCALLELKLLDHLIITKFDYVSFADDGIL